MKTDLLNGSIGIVTLNAVSMADLTVILSVILQILIAFITIYNLLTKKKEK